MPVSFKDTDTKRIEFGSRNAASDIRDDLPEEALLESDDGQTDLFGDSASETSGAEYKL